MNRDEMKEWVGAYIKATEHPENKKVHKEYFWAIEGFMDAADNDPESCWSGILNVLHHEPNDHVIGILAAGPLEDFIEHNGEQYIEKIEIEARQNPAFTHLLGGVWECSTKEIWSRVLKARHNKSW